MSKSSRRDTPGAGLILNPEEIDLSEFAEDEEPTRQECRTCGSPLVTCPACLGEGKRPRELKVKPTQIVPGEDHTSHSAYSWGKCDYCNGETRVSLSKAERWALLQRSDSGPARTAPDR